LGGGWVVKEKKEKKAQRSGIKTKERKKVESGLGRRVKG
jgi:hypothetical protein